MNDLKSVGFSYQKYLLGSQCLRWIDDFGSGLISSADCEAVYVILIVKLFKSFATNSNTINTN